MSYGNDRKSLLDIVQERFWWIDHLPSDITSDACEAVARLFTSDEFADALGDAAAHEPLSMMWLAAAKAECLDRGTTLEDVVDIF